MVGLDELGSGELAMGRGLVEELANGHQLHGNPKVEQKFLVKLLSRKSFKAHVFVSDVIDRDELSIGGGVRIASLHNLSL